MNDVNDEGFVVERRPMPDFDENPMLAKRPPAKYPFRTMKVGDCLIAPGGPNGTAMNSKAYNAMRAFMDRDNPAMGGEGRKFRAKKLDDKPGYIGIWRVK